MIRHNCQSTGMIGLKGANIPRRWNLPYQRNPLFTGREELLTQLYHHFQERGADPTLALTGQCGIGKTQVAVNLCSKSIHMNK